MLASLKPNPKPKKLQIKWHARIYFPSTATYNINNNSALLTQICMLYVFLLSFNSLSLPFFSAILCSLWSYNAWKQPIVLNKLRFFQHWRSVVASSLRSFLPAILVFSSLCFHLGHFELQIGRNCWFLICLFGGIQRKMVWVGLKEILKFVFLLIEVLFVSFGGNEFSCFVFWLADRWLYLWSYLSLYST